MDFQHPLTLIGSGLVLLAGCGWIFRHVRAVDRLERQFNLPGHRRPWLHHWPAAMLLSTLVICLAALAGPRWGMEAETVYTSGTDLYFMIDCSYSMLAADSAPDRIRAASFLASDLLKKLPGARAGLIAFAGNAFPVCPLTSDSQIVLKLLHQMHPDILSRQGTDFNAPLATLASILSKREEGRRLAVFFISDGEAFEMPRDDILRDLRQAPMQLFVVGIGSPEGARIPDPRRRYRDWIKDTSGHTVLSRLMEKNLIALANQLDGHYYRFQTVGLTAERLMDSELRQADRGAFSLRLHPKDRAPVFAWLVYALLGVLVVFHRRRWTGFPAKTTAATLALLLGSCQASRYPAFMEEANQCYHRGEYARASELYRQAMTAAGAGSAAEELAAVNLSAALALQGKTSDGLKLLHRHTRPETPGRFRHHLLYNLGCLELVSEHRPEAIAAFRQVLERRPGDFQARWNLELALFQNPGSQPPPPPEKPRDREPSDRFLDSLQDQEKSENLRRKDPTLGSGGPYW